MARRDRGFIIYRSSGERATSGSALARPATCLAGRNRQCTGRMKNTAQQRCGHSPPQPPLPLRRSDNRRKFLSVLLAGGRIAAAPPRENIDRGNVSARPSISARTGVPLSVHEDQDTHGSLGPTSPHPKRHLDQFILFSTARVCDQQTHRHTDHATSVTVGRIFMLCETGLSRCCRRTS